MEESSLSMGRVKISTTTNAFVVYRKVKNDMIETARYVKPKSKTGLYTQETATSIMVIATPYLAKFNKNKQLSCQQIQNRNMQNRTDACK